MTEERALSALHFWFGTTIIQSVITIIFGLMAMFFEGRITLFLFSVMVVFLVFDFIAVWLMLRQYKKFIQEG